VCACVSLSTLKYKIKEKQTLCLNMAQQRHTGGTRVRLLSFLTSVLDIGEWSATYSGCFNLGRGDVVYPQWQSDSACGCATRPVTHRRNTR
jgi:hypothetical protein